MTQTLRIVFAGTPDFAARHLQALLDWPGGALVGVYTQPDRPAGRGKKLSASAVKALAEARRLPLRQPNSLRDPQAQAELAALKPDVMVVVAYGLILPAAVLAIPRLGCVNVHASLLPRWRGAAPIQRAIEAGDAETGVTLMQMDEGLDTGPMLARVPCPIAADDTAASLHDRLAEIGPPALLATLAELAAGSARPVVQDDSQSCYAPKLDKAEGALDWRLPAAVLDRRIRAFTPAPGAYAELDGRRIRIVRATPEAASATPGSILAAAGDGLRVACGEGSLRITELQLPGGKPLPVAAVLNGHPTLFAPGRRFDGA
jgi:methionyl-tRNA formyltransferase